jgi:hypothetical protein
LRGVQPVHFGHGDVHDYYVRLKVSRHSNGFGAIGSLTDYLPLLPRRQQPSQGRAHGFFVVDDQDSKAH